MRQNNNQNNLLNKYLKIKVIYNRCNYIIMEKI